MNYSKDINQDFTQIELEKEFRDLDHEFYENMRNSNEEILQMRKELFNHWESTLLKQFCEIDVRKSLRYFLSFPCGKFKNKSSLNALLQCCEAAKYNRENRE